MDLVHVGGESLLQSLEKLHSSAAKMRQRAHSTVKAMMEHSADVSEGLHLVQQVGEWHPTCICTLFGFSESRHIHAQQHLPRRSSCSNHLTPWNMHGTLLRDFHCFTLFIVTNGDPFQHELATF